MEHPKFNVCTKTPYYVILGVYPTIGTDSTRADCLDSFMQLCGLSGTHSSHSAYA